MQRFLSLLLAAVAFALAACSSIPVTTEADPEADLESYRSYAWQADLAKLEARPEEDPPPYAKFRKAIEAGLAARGMSKTSRDEAALLLEDDLRIVVEQVHQDPYFAYYTTVIYEDAVLVLRFTDPKTDRMVWRGEGRSPLREIEKGAGLYEPQMVEESNPRVWKVEELVEAILDKTPWEATD